MRTEVGFGQTVITPAMPVVLAGFGARKGPVDDVHDDLEVQAVVCRTGEVTLCLLVLDLLLLGADYTAPIRAAVAAALNSRPDQVLTSCTHTHSGPAATTTLRRIGWPAPAGYLEVVVDGCVSAARAALAAAEPATFGYARAPLPDGLSLNRRGLPYDPSFAVLDVRRAADGTRLGGIANVGIHPVALGVTCRAVSRDWVGSFRDAITARTGTPTVLLPAALGDVNPARDPHTQPDAGGNWATAAGLGREIADCVAELIPTCTSVGTETGVVRRRVERVRAGVTLPTVLTHNALRRVDVELLEWSLGGVRLVSIPGEPFHAMGRAVEHRHGDRALIAALAPSYQGYLPAPYGKGYEEKMSYGRGFVHAVHELLVDGAGSPG